MINFIVTNSGKVIVVDGSLLTEGLTNIALNEVRYGLFELDNMAPIAKEYMDADTWYQIAQSMESGDLNNAVKEALGTFFGGMAGAWVYQILVA